VDSPKKHWKSEEYLGLKPTSHDWARLAAYIDGEGSINLSLSSRKGTNKTFSLCARVVVTNTDSRLAKWCLDNFGMRFYGHSNNTSPRRSDSWKGCYYAQACGYKAAWILYNCVSWFILKREQAEVVMAHQETIGPDVWQRGSGEKTPQHIIDIRLGYKRRLNELNKRGPSNSQSETLRSA
jgi:hypothetical protein